MTGGTEEINKIPIRLSSLLFEIETRGLLNTNQEY